ncbi:MAG: hypothetical protein HY515_02550 [Candidatus Aenigmarchaeota archaeon]|nr:hypothetical protein [Candidatus Aenigmarchaeota archaeon]
MQNEEELTREANSHRMKSEVFAINFIRHEFLSSSIRRFLVYFVFGYLGISIITAVILVMMAFGAHVRYHHIQGLLKRNALSGAQVKDLETEMKMLGTQIASSLEQLNSLNTFQKGRFPIADKLAGLTRTVPTRTWITALRGDANQAQMTIEATFLVDPADPYQLPTKPWIQLLKKDPDFGRNLKRLELKKSSQNTQGKTELYTFEFLAEWQPVVLDGNKK